MTKHCKCSTLLMHMTKHSKFSVDAVKLYQETVGRDWLDRLQKTNNACARIYEKIFQWISCPPGDDIGDYIVWYLKKENRTRHSKFIERTNFVKLHGSNADLQNVSARWLTIQNSLWQKITILNIHPVQLTKASSSVALRSRISEPAGKVSAMFLVRSFRCRKRGALGFLCTVMDNLVVSDNGGDPPSVTWIRAFGRNINIVSYLETGCLSSNK